MKFLTIVALLLLGSALAYAQTGGGVPQCAAQEASKWNWGAPSGGLKIAASVAKSQFKPGEPVHVHICVQNVGSNALALDHLSGPFVDCVVTDLGSGSDLTITSEGRKLLEPPAFFNAKVYVLRRADLTQSVFDITKLFDLSKPGRYSIRASRGARVNRTRNSSGPPAKSQEIEITVVDK